MTKKEKIYYSSFNKLGRNIIITLRRNPNAIIVYPSSFDIDRVIEYLRQRGYPANPCLDKNAQYLMDNTIDKLNNSNVLMSRILMRKRSKW